MPTSLKERMNRQMIAQKAKSTMGKGNRVKSRSQIAANAKETMGRGNRAPSKISQVTTRLRPKAPAGMKTLPDPRQMMRPIQASRAKSTMGKGNVAPTKRSQVAARARKTMGTRTIPKRSLKKLGKY